MERHYCTADEAKKLIKDAPPGAEFLLHARTQAYDANGVSRSTNINCGLFTFLNLSRPQALALAVRLAESEAGARVAVSVDRVDDKAAYWIGG